MNKYLEKIAAGFGSIMAGEGAEQAASRIASVGQNLKGAGGASGGAVAGGAAVSKGAKGMKMDAGETGAPVLDAAKSGFFNK